MAHRGCQAGIAEGTKVAIAGIATGALAIAFYVLPLAFAIVADLVDGWFGAFRPHHEVASPGAWWRTACDTTPDAGRLA